MAGLKYNYTLLVYNEAVLIKSYLQSTSHLSTHLKFVVQVWEQFQQRSKLLIEAYYTITDTVLPTVPYSKLVGVDFDSHMTWEVHTNHTHSKINKLLFLLKQIKMYLLLFAPKLFYNAHILPHFDFCCVIWGICSGKLLNDLYALQKKAARLILDTDCSERSKGKGASL